MSDSYYCGDCPFRGRCTDNGQKCETCVNNPRRSFYEPIPPAQPHTPYIPWYWYPWPSQPWYVGDPPPWMQPTTTCNATDNIPCQTT